MFIPVVGQRVWRSGTALDLGSPIKIYVQLYVYECDGHLLCKGIFLRCEERCTKTAERNCPIVWIFPLAVHPGTHQDPPYRHSHNSILYM